ncbi:MAG TPA: glycoside hydrolase family 2 TIM barrel-domain containing protein [Candidatus Binatia bacterium]|nr:glycoside hydrolase family 2 TIM barrel-domain containing protein [Candidatus Binatia bacterium]
MQSCALGAFALGAGPILAYPNASGRTPNRSGPASRTVPLNRDWLFGGKFNPAAQEAAFDDSAFAKVTLPHCVAKLSWQNWEPAAWADHWIYRRHFDLPDDLKNSRVFLDFEAVMTGATPVINGLALTTHSGGYLPFDYELTDKVNPKGNVLAVAVDGRWQNVPPEGSPKGPQAVDYLEPAGLHRSVSLRFVPQVFIRDVFAKPVKVLDSDRRVEVTCSLDAAIIPSKPLRLKADLLHRGRVIASATREVHLDKSGETNVALTLSSLGKVELWEPATPNLYEVFVTLLVNDEPWHDYRTRIGFREARFEIDGFFLNGRRFQIFGLDRHEIYPYVGAAMPLRVLRRDAEILRREFNCNFVRCSHYPQSEAFLDACDDLGLMVWEELPGWQYIGDEAWQDLAVRDVNDMVRRDRNHPGIVIWGVRINESANNPALYTRTKTAAKALDDSRPTSGAMNRYSTTDWLQDVYAYDDYHSAPDGTVGVRDPLPGVPYFLTEGVGQFAYGPGKGGFGRRYRRAGELDVQQQQALWHAQIHDRAQRAPRIAGVVAWCGFDYASLINHFHTVKCPGVADVFRIPKLGAAFYQAQVDPQLRPVIQPDFYWDFSPKTPSGPGDKAAIFSNCDRLELWVNRKLHASVLPDRENYPNLRYPPFFANLSFDGVSKPELRIDGFLGKKRVLSRSFSADVSRDKLQLQADDTELVADGSDATRLVFRATDKFGAPRPFVGGEVTLELSGPGVIVGDNPFRWDDSGGVGAVWIKTVPNQAGRIRVAAGHSSLGRNSVEITSSAKIRG